MKKETYNSFFSEINILKRLPLNNLGRDFVVGDVHGSKSLLDALLKQVRFDVTRDRLFMVGDLVDRGPESMACLEYLAKPWCHAVMGNHEELLLGAFWSILNPDQPRPDFFYGSECAIIANGGMWALEHMQALSDEFRSLLDYVSRLPQIIVVGEEYYRFNIVHAELPESYTDAAIDKLPTSLDVYHYDQPCLRWERRRMKAMNHNMKLPPLRSGLSTTYTGHTIGTQIRRAESHVCLDTGGFISYTDNSHCLTMIQPATGTVFNTRDGEQLWLSTKYG